MYLLLLMRIFFKDLEEEKIVRKADKLNKN